MHNPLLVLLGVCRCNLSLIPAPHPSPLIQVSSGAHMSKILNGCVDGLQQPALFVVDKCLRLAYCAHVS